MNTAHIITGTPAAGKTTFAKRYGTQHALPLIDIDTVTGRLIQRSLKVTGKDPNDRDSKEFKDTFREDIYETLFDVARENLEWMDVIIVGPFTREIRDPEWPAKLQKRLHANIEVYYMYCPPELRVQRMKERASPRDILKFQNWEEINATYGDEAPPPFEHNFIDTSKEENIATYLQR